MGAIDLFLLISQDVQIGDSASDGYTSNKLYLVNLDVADVALHLSDLA